jgi:hypothetical protein
MPSLISVCRTMSHEVRCWLISELVKYRGYSKVSFVMGELSLQQVVLRISSVFPASLHSTIAPFLSSIAP